MSKASTLSNADRPTRNTTGVVKRDRKEQHRDTFTPDTGRAWVVAFASMLNVFLLMGFYRSLGILVVELMNIYEAPTAKASLIFSCISIGFFLSAILFIFGVGDIIHERALVAASAFLGFFGFVVTFFSTRIEHVCVQGICTGAAIQIGLTCGMSLLGRYFDKRLSVANGILMSGSSLGALVYPPVIQWLLDEYTYRGTALICAGLTLNTLACCLPMRPVPGTVKSKMVPPQQDGPCIMTGTGCSEISDEREEKKHPTNDVIDAGINTALKDTSNATYFVPDPDVNLSDVSNCLDAGINTAIKDSSNATYFVPHPDVNLSDVPNCLDAAMNTANKNSSTYFVPDPDMEVSDASSTEDTADDRRSAHYLEKLKLAIRQFCLKDTRDKPVNASVGRRILPSVSLLKNPALPFLQMFMFFSSAGSECVMQYYAASTRELGMSEYQSAFLLSIAGIGDFLSRVGFGLLGDYNFMARYKLVMIPQLVLGTACFLSRFATEFWSQSIFAVVVGLTVGTSTAYKAVLLIDFFGLEDLSRLLGMSSLACSAGAASGSPMIGYLRDLTGDYEVPFQTIGVYLFAAGLGIQLAGTCKWWQKRKRG